MADVFEDEVEHTVSIQEYLDNVEEEELEADLVLGGDEGKECTYTNGYMKRQAIFSCITCIPDGNAGVCTACSLSCHDGHEIVELWTKRNFKCDCGNSKFGEFYCKLYADKDPENSENSYNQNFKGSYCTCARPYPDPDAEEQVEMIQCCICEDWLHETHLGLQSTDEIPRDEEGEPTYEDFICQGCEKKCSFLSLYPPTIWAPVLKPDNASADPPNPDNASTDLPKPENASADLPKPENTSANLPNTNGESVDLPKSASNGSSPKCVLEVDPRTAPPTSKPMFLTKNWRGLLCKCEPCVKFYAEKGISFLIDKEDTIAEYEKMGKQKREEKLQQQEGAEIDFLGKLGHVQKVELLSGIADMKNELQSFLASVDTSKPVTAADVHQVFENLAKKRQRLQ
ncbi:RING-type E3 ubiquitin transferase [Ranunculus cassubicifolius]